MISPNTDFAIYQNDITKETYVYEKHLGWIKHPPATFDMWKHQKEFIEKYPQSFSKLISPTSSLFFEIDPETGMPPPID